MWPSYGGHRKLVGWGRLWSETPTRVRDVGIIHSLVRSLSHRIVIESLHFAYSPFPGSGDVGYNWPPRSYILGRGDRRGRVGWSASWSRGWRALWRGRGRRSVWTWAAPGGPGGAGGGRHRAVSQRPGPCRRLPLAFGREAHLTVWSGRVLCGLGRATGPLQFGFLGCRMRVVPGLSSLDCREDG